MAHTNELNDPLLLKLFHQHVRQRLVEKLKPIANEVMREAVEEAMGDLSVHVKSQFLDYGNKLVLRLVVDGIEKELTS